MIVHKHRRVRLHQRINKLDDHIKTIEDNALLGNADRNLQNRPKGNQIGANFSKLKLKELIGSRSM
jgi:hypothetical protein